MNTLDLESEPKWVLPKIDKAWCDQITKEFNIHPVTAQVLVSRGFESFEEIHHYLYAKLPNLHDPNLFVDMSKATDRILHALRTKENILIYGDNDVDGISGTALLVDFLRELGADAFFYVPNRNSLKQSIILDALEFAKQNGCTLLITVDCGITAASEIDELERHQVDVIVTDHHEPTARIPHCVATLNPKLISSTYPNREITGVGVAFKLAHAITNVLVSNGHISKTKIALKQFLDLVALGTIADMGSLRDENRIMVRYGLRQFAHTKRIGLIKLLEVCDLGRTNLTTIDIASKVAPRLNSLGRIADPIKGVELLLIQDPVRAEELAKELDLNNSERQRIERKDSDDIEGFIEDNQNVLDSRAIILDSEKWHPGIIPIISARIAKQYNRPTVIISVDKGIGKGSIRTIPEFPLLNELRKHSHLLINYGGHDFAAGLTIKAEHIPEFRKKFIDAANSILKAEDVHPKLYLDSPVEFNEITFDFLDSLSLLEPYGVDNPPPLLYCSANQAWPPKIVGRSHLKLYLEQGDRLLEGIGFGLADRRSKLMKKNMPLQIAFTPHVNIFLNKSSIQLQIKDFKAGSGPL
ncbi:MAG: Single-stranded-DNA-specific exonuclease RecJ [Chlamydiia bacterium]|nr:Single-stranded-DNA-specific exonuclease RecJ [Chlamydiia bacterium]MCH9616505.1 Single-stranded-DNA-specific exonuclease RecJ [Chlamydiia bacterium]MCH9629509.1 Single-stranded-DNA-specific exonuclease RecJ [Chlamydiia bacterium]